MKFIIAIILLTFVACSHQAKKKSISISSPEKGFYKNANISIPVYITNKIENENKGEKILKVHQGHFLSLKNQKEQNVALLKALEEANFHLVNLSLEDIAIAEFQNIKFEDFKKLIFLNSTVIDTARDDLYGKSNVVPYFIFEDVVFIGLSDNEMSSTINKDRFLISDYVLSILKMKKVMKEKNFKSYILIHHLGSEINDIINRLPPTFSDSLAN